MLSEGGYLALVWSLMALGTLFTGIRLVVRRLGQHRFHADDWFALGSWFSLLTLAALYTANSRSLFFLSYMQRDIYLGIPPPQPITEIMYHYKLFAIVQMVAMIFFWTTLWAGKLSLLMFFRRLMNGIKMYRPWWWGVFVVSVVTYLACFLSNFLTCLPIERRWSIDTATNCATPDAIQSAVTSIEFASYTDVVTDLIIMLLPLPLLWGLRITLLQKIGLAVVFCLGGIVIVFAILRMRSVTESIGSLSHTSAIDLAMWSMIECAVAVVVISLPSLRGLLTGNLIMNTSAYGSRGKSNGPTAGTGGMNTYASQKSGKATGGGGGGSGGGGGGGGGGIRSAISTGKGGGDTHIRLHDLPEHVHVTSKHGHSARISGGHDTNSAYGDVDLESVSSTNEIGGDGGGGGGDGGSSTSQEELAKGVNHGAGIALTTDGRIRRDSAPPPKHGIGLTREVFVSHSSTQESGYGGNSVVKF